MYNFKWGLIAAIAAFFISVFLGIISGVSLFFIIIRALAFTAVFFGLGFGLRFVINSFFPELLFNEEETATGEYLFDKAGSQANITVDNTGEYAIPELYKTDDSHELGNIEDLISGVFRPRPAAASAASVGIDRKREAGYNMGGVQTVSDVFSGMGGIDFSHDQEIDDSGSTSAFDSAPAEKPVFTPSFGDDSELGGLPDLDMMARAFSSGYSAAPAPAAAPSPRVVATEMSEPSFTSPVGELESDKPRYTGNKPQSLKGDFNPKELAEGLRSVLAKEK